MIVMQRLRILPLLVIVAGLAFTVRVGEVFYGLDDIGSAHAQEEVQAEAPPMPETEDDGENDAGQSGMEESAEGSGDGSEDNGEEGEVEDWQDAGEADFAYSEVQAGLYKDLAERRRELEQREKELGLQRALLEATERELNQKMRELTAVRDEIQLLLREENKEEDARVNSLVKIYEGMKAKDAARIFNTLDIGVLISVIAEMSERKSAPILAAMNPERARTVTILLAQRKQLPELPPQ